LFAGRGLTFGFWMKTYTDYVEPPTPMPVRCDSFL